LNPPDISPLELRRPIQAPAVKGSSEKVRRLGRGNGSKSVKPPSRRTATADAAPAPSEEEIEAALKAARVEARSKRRAAAAAEANLGCWEEAASAPRVADKAAVDRIASMIQVNVKKEASTLHDVAHALPPPVDNSASDAHDEPEMFPMAAASIETWGGLVMRCSHAASSLRAVDFG